VSLIALSRPSYADGEGARNGPDARAGTTTVIELVIYAFHIARLGTASRGA